MRTSSTWYFVRGMLHPKLLEGVRARAGSFCAEKEDRGDREPRFGIVSLPAPKQSAVTSTRMPSIDYNLPLFAFLYFFYFTVPRSAAI